MLAFFNDVGIEIAYPGVDDGMMIVQIDTSIGNFVSAPIGIFRHDRFLSGETVCVT